MLLNETTLEELRKIINEKSQYRSGPVLVGFFNSLGFKDTYGEGFPSRWAYTDSRLKTINGKPELDKCIKSVFAPNLFIGNYQFLDELIEDFNQYISYDGWLVKRREREITFIRTKEIYEKEVKVTATEKEFLSVDFGEIDLSKIKIEDSILSILTSRITELQIIIQNAAPLSSIIMMGSILEGLFLAIASKYPKEYNISSSSPKDKEGNTRKFYEWTLNDFINVTYEIGGIKEDVHKFASSLRYFRNYIHPYQQMSTGFIPTEDTVKICYQVLKATISQISKSKYS
jgi:hypothetical protein